MITCALCGNEYKSITPSHLMRKHSITLTAYREMFPTEAIYERMRYMKIVQRPAEDFGDMPLEVGLNALQRYSPDLASDTILDESRALQLSTWSKKTRARIERLFG